MIIGVSGKIGSGKDLVGQIIKYHIYNKDRINKGFNPIKNFHQFDDGHLRETNWQIVKFDDKLKDIVCILLGCTRKQLEDREFKETPLGEEWIRYGYADGHFYSSKGTVMNNESCSKERYEQELHNNWQTAYKLHHTPRTIMQLLGTQVGRFIHPNTWVNITMNNYRPYGYEKGSNKNVADVLEDIHFDTLIFPNWIITDVRFPNEANAIKQRNGINIRLERNGNSNINNQQHESETALDDYKFDYIIDNNYSIEELIERVKEILLIEKII